MAREIIRVKDNTIAGGPFLLDEGRPSEPRVIRNGSSSDDGRETGGGVLGKLTEGVGDMVAAYPRAVATAIGLTLISPIARADEDYSPKTTEKRRKKDKKKGVSPSSEALRRSIRWESQVAAVTESARRARGSESILERLAKELLQPGDIGRLDKAFVVGQSTAGSERPEEVNLAQRMVTREVEAGSPQGPERWLDVELGIEARNVYLARVGGAKVDQEEFNQLRDLSPEGRNVVLVDIPVREAFLASLLGAIGWKGNMFNGKSVQILLEGHNVRIKRGQETDTVTSLENLLPDTIIPDGVEALMAARRGDLGGEKLKKLVERIIGNRRIPTPGSVLLGREGAKSIEYDAVPVLDAERVLAALIKAKRAFLMIKARTKEMENLEHVYARDKEELRELALNQAEQGMFQLPRRVAVNGEAEKIRANAVRENGRDRTAMRALTPIQMTPAEAGRYLEYSDDHFRNLEAEYPDHAQYMHGVLVSRSIDTLLERRRAAEVYIKNADRMRGIMGEKNPVFGNDVHEMMLRRARERMALAE